tara:strand:- start:1432 stop:1818 length:387 start_codon:yes stop_codon:yes gene_type:complete
MFSLSYLSSGLAHFASLCAKQDGSKNCIYPQQLSHICSLSFQISTNTLNSLHLSFILWIFFLPIFLGAVRFISVLGLHRLVHDKQVVQTPNLPILMGINSEIGFGSLHFLHFFSISDILLLTLQIKVG